MQFRSSLMAVIGLLSLPMAAPFQKPSKLPLPTTVIHQFYQGSWIENIAARSNGNLLLTFLDKPDLYEVSPSKPSKATLLHSFTGRTSLLGITEIAHDIFVLATGNYSIATSTPTPGTFSVWKVDFTRSSSSASIGGGSGPKISKLADIPEAGLGNGLTSIPGTKTVLLADSVLGSVWAVDAATGRYGVVLDFDELAPPANSSIPLGVNGIHIRNGYLYWSNTAAQVVYRAKITSAGTLAGGARPELVARLETVVDDFAVDEQGQVWVTTNIGNTVELVSKSGKTGTVVGAIGSLAVAGDTAAVFGRGKKDKEVLYVVTCGALVRPVNGTITEPGKVVAVDTKRLQI